MTERQNALSELRGARRLLLEAGPGASPSWLEAALSYVDLCEERVRAEERMQRAQPSDGITVDRGSRGRPD